MTPSDNTNPEEEKGIFSDPSLWKLNTNPVVKESLTTQLIQLVEQDLQKLQSENDQLKKEVERLNKIILDSQAG